MKQVIMVIFLFIPLIVHAATLESKDEVRSLARSAMEKVGAGDIDGGFKVIKPYVIIPGSEFEVMVENYQLQAPAIERRFGKTLGIEFLSEEIVGESLMKISYLQKFEKHAMRWRFYFYRPGDEWVLNTFYTDDKITKLFE